MTNPEPHTYNEILAHFTEVSENAKKIGRLETLTEVIGICSVILQRSKSKIEIRTLEEIVKRLQELKA